MTNSKNIEYVIQKLQDKKSKTRLAALQTLMELKNIKGLTKALKNDDIKVCLKAISVMENIKNERVVEPLIHFLTKDLNTLNFKERLWGGLERALEILNPSQLLEITHQLLSRARELLLSHDMSDSWDYTRVKENLNEEEVLRKTVGIKPTDKQKKELYKFVKFVLQKCDNLIPQLNSIKENYDEFFNTVIKKIIRKKVLDILMTTSTDFSKEIWYDATQAIVDTISDEKDDVIWQNAFETLRKILDSKGWGNNEAKFGFWMKTASDLLQKQRPQPALKCFEKAIEIDANDARGWGGKGNVLFNLKNYEEAQKYFEKAFEINPEFDNAFNMLLEIRYLKKDYVTMASLARKRLESKPKDIKARIMLSKALIFSNELNKAESEAQKALEIAFQNEYLEAEDLGMVYQQLGITSTMRGHKEKAIESFQKALDAQPKDGWIQELLNSYNILDILGLVINGSPIERRNRLINLAMKRLNASKGIGVTDKEYVIFKVWMNNSPINVMDKWSGRNWVETLTQTAMIKFWPPVLFTRASQILSSSRFESFGKDLDKIIMTKS